MSKEEHLVKNVYIKVKKEISRILLISFSYLVGNQGFEPWTS